MRTIFVVLLLCSAALAGDKIDPSQVIMDKEDTNQKKHQKLLLGLKKTPLTEDAAGLIGISAALPKISMKLFVLSKPPKAVLNKEMTERADYLRDYIDESEICLRHMGFLLLSFVHIEKEYSETFLKILKSELLANRYKLKMILKTAEYFYDDSFTLLLENEGNPMEYIQKSITLLKEIEEKL